jgi:intein/homing endonuclease
MMPSKLTIEQQKDVVNRYVSGEKNTNLLANNYCVRKPIIRRILKKNGVIFEPHGFKKIYFLNDNYFNIIDSEEKAYILGLFYADGYNGEDKHFSCISLQEGDREILEKISKILESNRPLSYIKRYGKRKSLYKLSINSKRISIDLKALGCVQAKSLILKFPTVNQVPENLIKHFVRGYFDGDGCISRHRRNKNCRNSYIITIISTESFCLDLLKEVKKINVNSTIIKDFRYKNGVTRRFSISGNEQVYTFLNWIYRDAKIFLERKMKKFLEFESERLNLKSTYTRSLKFKLNKDNC